MLLSTNSALYSLTLFANPTIIHKNRIVLQVLTILLLLSRKYWRGKCESTVEATPLLWCGLSCVGRHGNAGRRRQLAIHVRALYLCRPHTPRTMSTCFIRGFAHALLITTQSDDSFVLFTFSNVNFNPRLPSGPLVYSTRPSLNRGKSLIGH